MTTRSRSARCAMAVALTGVLLLGACSDGDHTGMEDTPSHGSDATAEISIPPGAAFNATDVVFSQGMIPHHAQAIVMADMALEVSTDPSVRALAEEIKAAQGPEIEQLTAWLTDWEQAVPDPTAPTDQDGHGADGTMMSGMMSDADMDRLGAATGTEFDRMFLEMMVLHHEGAVVMAQEQLDSGMFEPTRELARAIIAAQQAEIDQMNALLASLS